MPYMRNSIISPSTFLTCSPPEVSGTKYVTYLYSSAYPTHVPYLLLLRSFLSTGIGIVTYSFFKSLILIPDVNPSYLVGTYLLTLTLPSPMDSRLRTFYSSS